MFKPRSLFNLAVLKAFSPLALLLACCSPLLGQGAWPQGQGWGNGSGSVSDSGPAARNAWWRLQIGGDLSPEFMRRSMDEAAKQRLLYPDHFHPEGEPPRMLPEGIPLPVALGATTWTNLGPTGSIKIQNSGLTLAKQNSGRVRAILPDPADANTVYVLTAGGGLWKTSNFQDTPPTWRCLTDQVGSTRGGSAAFGKAKSGAGAVLHLGLGDPFDMGVGGFMVRSLDAGQTWSTPIQLSGTVSAITYTATQVLDVKVDDTAATEATTTVLVGTDAGLFRSTDGGASFAIVDNASFNGRRIWSLARVGPLTWLAAAEDTSSGTGVIMRSTTGGLTWVAASPIAGGRMTLSNVPGEATVYCFAAAVGDAAQLDLYKSTTGGTTAWAATNTTSGSAPATTNTDQNNNNYMHGNGYYDQMLLVDPQDLTRNTLYIGGDLSSAKNTNGGATGGTAATKWNLQTNWFGKFSLPYAHGGFQCAAKLDLGATHRVFLGTNGGFFYSDDGGATWDDSKNVGLVSHMVWALASGPLSSCAADSILMGTEDNATVKRVGATTTFNQTRSGTTVGALGNYDGFGVGWSQATDTYSFSSLGYNNIYRCTTNPPDDATEWATFTGGLATPRDSSNYYLVTPIIAAPPGADPTGTVFYTYGDGANNRRVYRTTGGANWTSLRRLASGTAVAAVSHGLGAHPTDGNRLATASNGGNVVITTNAFATAPTTRDLMTLVPASGGRTWKGNNSNVAWVDNNILFAASVSTAPNSIHVARTADGGATWAAAETGLPDLPVVKIVVDPGDPNTLYAATWLGVYRTINSGTSWSLFGSGLPQGLVTDLYVHPNGNFLRAAIFGRGVWQVGGVPAYVAPAFSVQPAGGSFTPPAGFSLTGTVSNTYPTVSYQWQKNGVNLVNGGGISGATTPTLTVSSTTCGSGGTYTLKATNCAGTTTSNAAIMTSTVAAPMFTTQPANTEYDTGNSFSLTVVATGSGLTYQWYQGATPLANGNHGGGGTGWVSAGGTTNTLTITNAQGATAGTYTCRVTSSGGCTVTSNNAIVIFQTTAGLVAPNICTSPLNLTVTAPASAAFTVTAGGGRVDALGRVFTFQWRRNGVNLTNVAPYTNAVFSPASSTSNTATATLTINPTSAALSGSVYDCVVTTTSGGSVPVTSGGAVLTVLNQYTPATAVSITPSATLPISRSGGSWPLSFTAVGSGSFLQGTGTPSPAGAYQYQFWIYVDDNLGWVMMQDYGVGSSYTLPATWQPGTYGVGVDCRTSTTVPFDVFNSIDYFTITPMRGPGDTSEPLMPQPRSRPRFNGGAVFVTKD